jgi:predicted nucleic acid-binding protein
MPGYLLDTNAISILAPRPGRENEMPMPAFRAWVREHDEALYLSTITLAEIQAGISNLERKAANKRAEALSHWLDAIMELYGSRVLSLNVEIALATGRLLDRAIGLGANPGFEDAAIAATAEVHGLTVITGNIRHFAPFGVRHIAPPN